MRRPVIAVLAALALASACSGGSDTPRALPSLTATSTPSATPVAIPSEATAHTPFGAAAFVRFYFDQLNRAYASANAAPIHGLADPACGTCKNYERATVDLHVRGQHLEGDSLVIVSAEAPPEQNGFVPVDVFMYAPARKVVNKSGSLVKAFPRGPQVHKTVYTRRTATGWLIRAVQAAS